MLSRNDSEQHFAVILRPSPQNAHTDQNYTSRAAPSSALHTKTARAVFVLPERFVGWAGVIHHPNGAEFGHTQMRRVVATRRHSELSREVVFTYIIAACALCLVCNMVLLLSTKHPLGAYVRRM